MDLCVISEIVNATWQELPLSVHSQENKIIVQETGPRHNSNKTANTQVVTLRTYWAALEDQEETDEHPAG